MWWRRQEEIGILKGKTLTAIERDGNDELLFRTDDGEVYRMYHESDCCESVEIEDITGDFSDLLNAPILMAEEVSEEGESEWGSATWTFYKFATINGYVTIRWLGESNGYYSESVDFVRIDDEQEE